MRWRSCFLTLWKFSVALATIDSLTSRSGWPAFGEGVTILLTAEDSRAIH